ncbi:MAG: type VI secretion system tube protein Hcp [Phycisphaerales bacterium]
MSTLDAHPIAFLQLSGVTGQSQDRSHKDWMEIKEVNFSATQPTGGIAAVGQGVQGAILVTRVLDKATPRLWGAVLGGKRYDEGKLETTSMIANDRKVVDTYEFKGVTIRSYQVLTEKPQDKSGTTRLVELVGLGFKELKFTHTSYDPVSGAVKGKQGFTYKAEEGTITEH